MSQFGFWYGFGLEGVDVVFGSENKHVPHKKEHSGSQGVSATSSGICVSLSKYEHDAST